MEKTCNDCENYDVVDGMCKITHDNHYDYEDACEDFEQKTDTMEGEDGYYIEVMEVPKWRIE